MPKPGSRRASSIMAMAAVALVVVALDQITKAWMISNVGINGVRVLIEGFLRLLYTQNTGVAFGLFQGWTYALIIVAIVIIAAIVLSASRVASSNSWLMLAMGLVLGGALGNLIDRLRFGYVIDFVQVYGPSIKVGNRVYTWPIFNVADSAITVGVVLIMVVLLFFTHEEKKSETPGIEPSRQVEPRQSP